MAFTFDASAGVTYDADGGTFDGPEIQIIDLGLSGFGVGSVEGFGLGEITLYVEAPPSINSAEVFGTTEAQLNINAPTTITSLEAFGTYELIQQLPFTGIVSTEAFGTAEAVLYLEDVSGNILSEEAFGTAEITIHMAMVGIESLEAFPDIHCVYAQWQADLAPQVAAWNEDSSRSDTWTK